GPVLPGTSGGAAMPVSPRFAVYDSRDLSRPLVPYLDGTPGKYHLADDGIYYVRVWHDDPTWVGKFDLSVRWHTGAGDPAPGMLPDVRDAMTLLPHEPVTRFLRPENAAGPGLREAWFQIDTDAPLSGEAQTLTFSVSPGSDFRLLLYVAGETRPLA